ncbi:DUF3533 domain-containing protein [Parafrankia sp. EUN1f]|uniref:DUF3533 domain-containing protein n=1 Tax=Parafrankia sp. EUN1f TaxID=102897 RepID=UPI0001C44E50|nr:DUF3533 domain-containing protein [Parafrankia sp. EUN1f]EFC83340.1 membrane protein-like protein [Parafrankia sp. EUN1f]
MCGFLVGTLLHSTVDAALGYGTSEVGPRWTQLQPKAISRWRTLLIKWVMAAALTAVVTGLMIAVGAGAVGMDAPHPLLLWVFSWLCAASVAAGTIVLFAALGTPGQLVALLLFVYAGLASAGGTVPIEALPGFFRLLSEAEPLRQILAGDRAIHPVLRRPGRRRPDPWRPVCRDRAALLARPGQTDRPLVRPPSTAPDEPGTPQLRQPRRPGLSAQGKTAEDHGP